MGAYLQGTCQGYTSRYHRQLRASLAQPSAHLDLTGSSCDPNRRCCTLISPSFRKRSHPSYRGCHLHRILLADWRQGQHPTISSSTHSFQVRGSPLAFIPHSNAKPGSYETPAPRSLAFPTPNSSKILTGTKSSWIRAAPHPNFQSGYGPTTQRRMPMKTMRRPSPA